MKKLKTLVIHPNDRSTDFLKAIYSGIKGAKVITGGLTPKEVIKEIKEHDRIMMMGHGTPYGLMSVGQFNKAGGYIINDLTAEHLKDKKCVFIWCNADGYVLFHKLSGFYSGMFVSEIEEAYTMGIQNPKIIDVEESNRVFSEIVSKHINKSFETMFGFVKKEYGLLAEGNPIALYNSHRLYLR